MANLDAAQLLTLKTDITVTNVDTMWEGNTIGYWYTTPPQQWSVIARFYKEPSSPSINLWCPQIPRDTLMDAIDAGEFKAMTQQEQNTWGYVLGTRDYIDATQAQTRTNFSDIFGGGVAPNTLAAMTAAALKVATRGEALYATPAGNEHVSAIFGEEITDGNISDTRSV